MLRSQGAIILFEGRRFGLEVQNRSQEAPKEDKKNYIEQIITKIDEHKSTNRDKKSSKKLWHRLTGRKGKGEKSSLVARAP